MLAFSDQRDIREGSSSRQHIRIVNLSNILHVFFSPPPHHPPKCSYCSEEKIQISPAEEEK